MSCIEIRNNTASKTMHSISRPNNLLAPIITNLVATPLAKEPLFVNISKINKHTTTIYSALRREVIIVPNLKHETLTTSSVFRKMEYINWPYLWHLGLLDCFQNESPANSNSNSSSSDVVLCMEGRVVKKTELFWKKRKPCIVIRS